MKQTAVEWLVEQIKSKADNFPTNTKENRMVKGIYVDCLMMAKQAKEMESQQQGYSEEDIQSLIKIRNYFGENDKTFFEHFAYSFLDRIIEQFKNK